MSVNLHKIAKWFNMLRGKSVYHVLQDEGKIYSKDEIRGYYNNLTDKVLRFGAVGNEVPKTVMDTGEEIYFSIAIFQYGLAAYDLYLIHNDCTMLEKTISCGDWAVENQQEDGAWVTFAYESPDKPYSSMAQGEGISLLLRANLATDEEKYLTAAKKALAFMLLPLEQGGTTKYDGDDVCFYECPADPLILNGWIFSLWGLYDYCKFFKDDKSKKTLSATLATLEKRISDFDAKYWSMYEDGKRICSPFYHKLHIAQLRVMYNLTGKECYKYYADKWEKYQNSFWKSKRAFIRKAMQKVFE